jgi:hypothetical protein
MQISILVQLDSMCQKYLRNMTSWLLPKQELLQPKHIDGCRLFETMCSQFIYIYIYMAIFQVSWLLHFPVSFDLNISSQLFHHQFNFTLHGRTSGIVQVSDSVPLHQWHSAGEW